MNAIELNEMKELSEWLNSRPRDYYRGAQLFRAYNPKDAMARSMQIYPNMPMLERKIRERYQELKQKRDMKKSAPIPEPVKPVQEVQQLTKTAVKEVVPKTEHVSPNAKETKKSDALKHFQKLEAERKQLFKNRGRWHADMCNVGKGKFRLSTQEKSERAQLAKMVDNSTIEIERLSNLMKFYELNGYFPEEQKQEIPEPIVFTPETAKKRLNNSIMPNISKLTDKILEEEKKLSTLKTKKEKQKAMDKIANWKAKKEILETERAELRQLVKSKV